MLPPSALPRGPEWLADFGYAPLSALKQFWQEALLRPDAEVNRCAAENATVKEP